MGQGYRSNLNNINVDAAAVTLATTMKALWPVALTMNPANYWKPRMWQKITAFGKATTDGTAGNYVFEGAYGAGDAPAALAAGATVAGTVSQTNISWTAWMYIECRTSGPTGTFRIWGQWNPAVALVASTLSPYLFPGSAPADITVDTTAASLAGTMQLQRSGTGVWTATTTNLILEEGQGA